MTHFTGLRLEEWQQFRSVDLEFHPRLTVLTGANASGKTTILNLLARHADWQVPALSVPRRSAISGVIQFVTRFFGGRDRSTEDVIGSISYASGQSARLSVPQDAGANYQINIGGQQPVPCFFIPSHRAVYRYERIQNIPTTRLNKQEAFNRVSNNTRSRYLGGGGQSSSFHMKECLVSWSIFGRGNPDMEADAELLELYEGFQAALRHVLPPTLGFRAFSIRNLEIVLECDSGDFMIDGASGGLSTLIDLAWQIYMFATEDTDGFTVLIDEVENHLHPTMQRSILSDFLAAFPSTRFIVSTHSPLIVNSVRDCTVYALRYNDERQVLSERLDFENRAATAPQVLDEVLGVSTTIPVWAEQELEALLQRLAGQNLNEELFTEFREALRAIGLQHYVPEALGMLLDSPNQ